MNPFQKMTTKAELVFKTIQIIFLVIRTNSSKTTHKIIIVEISNSEIISQAAITGTNDHQTTTIEEIISMEIIGKTTRPVEVLPVVFAAKVFTSNNIRSYENHNDRQSDSLYFPRQQDLSNSDSINYQEWCNIALTQNLPQKSIKLLPHHPKRACFSDHDAQQALLGVNFAETIICK